MKIVPHFDRFVENHQRAFDNKVLDLIGVWLEELEKEHNWQTLQAGGVVGIPLAADSSLSVLDQAIKDFNDPDRGWRARHEGERRYVGEQGFASGEVQLVGAQFAHLCLAFAK